MTTREEHTKVDAESEYVPTNANTVLGNVSEITSAIRCSSQCVSNELCLTATYYTDLKMCCLFSEDSAQGTISGKANAKVIRLVDRGTTDLISTSASVIITSMPTISNQLCNIITCRSVIADYISRYWAYNTVNFGECIGCSQATFPDFPSDWSTRWYAQDIYIPTSAGQDCVGNPYTGNLTECQRSCLLDATCTGFAREKNVTDTDSTGQCWLKNNTLLNQILNDLVWYTVVFNTTS